jgi:P4 family phage/plasmid primase-like protien
LWKSFKDERSKKVTIKSLKRMAFLDNPVEYNKIMRTKTKEIMNNIYEKNYITELNLVHLFYSLYSTNFVYDNDQDIWYYLNNYGLYVNENKHNLEALRLLEEDFNDFIKADNRKRLNNEKDSDKKKNILKMQTRFDSLLENKRTMFNILTLIKPLYKQKNVFEKMDNVNNYLIGFTNGVYDLENRVFRKAEHYEYISCTTGYDYKKVNIKIKKEIHTFISNIFPDYDEKKFVLKTLSLGLVGCNMKEMIYVHVGSGANGKSLLSYLLDVTLGGYYDDMPIDYLAKTKHQGHANSADPIMARKKNCRIVTVFETDEDVKIREDKLKQLSGRDRVQVRDLFKSSFSFIPKFKLIIQTNKVPQLDGTDEAIQRRLCYIVFPNKFVKNPKKSNERLLDENLKERISNDLQYRIAFF